MRSAIPSQAPSEQAELRAAAKSLGRLTSARRVRPTYVKAGAGLVAVCGVGIGVTVAGIGGRIPVLQVAVPVSAGQQLLAEDLRTVDVAADAGLGLIPASRQADVIGRVAAVPLTEGDLITTNKIGPSATFPPLGQAVASAALKQGAYPTELKAGDRVAVLLNPDTPTATTGVAAPAMQATILSVKNADTSGTIVVSLLTDQNSALRIGQAGTTPVALVVEPAAVTGAP